MYCSTCGNEIKTELNYCNRCGARVDKIEKNGADNSGPGYLSMATGFVCLGGLGLTVGLIAMLLKNNVALPFVVILALAFLCAVFGISCLMIQQISRMTKSASSEKIPDKPNPAQVGAINTAQLEEYHQPTMSVTENTTRTFDIIPLEKN
jgi:DNA-directed RNA polymerase subunit RPC12/RpoP